MAGALLLVVACSFDYTAGTADALRDQVPDTVMQNVTHTGVRGGLVTVELSSDRVENFSSDGRAVLTNVSYIEYDRDGSIANTGRADRAIIFSATDNAEVSGAIWLRSEGQETEITADELQWQDDSKRLSSATGRTVRLLRDDGTEVSGSGFEVDVRTKTVRFGGRVAGTLVVDSD